MIGILGGMGTQAGLDFCNKLALLNRGKTDQQYPLFILYNKSNIPKRPENIKKYYNVLKSLGKGSLLLQKNNCKFIVIPCNTAHYWYEDLQKKIGPQKLLRLQDVATFRSDHPRKKSGIQLRSQIV